MIKKIIYSLVLLSSLLLFNSCKKGDVPISDIFKSLTLSKNVAIGDGAQTIAIVCEVDPDASDDKQEFLLRTSIGTFAENQDNKLVKKPEFKSGKLIIETSAKVPLSAGTMVISVEPNQPLERTDYIIKDSVIVSRSVATTIHLATSALGIGSNFQSEVQLTGTLANASGGKVSTGHKVVFEDSLLTGAPASGRYRDILNTSDNQSKVSAFYGAGSFPIGTDIKIKATLLNENGIKTNIVDSIILRINL